MPDGFSNFRKLAVVGLALSASLALPPLAAAENVPAARQSADQPSFTQEQLDQMLAPLALYPDDLLSQILMASTYPIELVQADRWAKLHADLERNEAAKALESEEWDASVKSLVAVPDLLALLSEKLEWTQQLGDAFIGQQADVLATVQQLRSKAKEAGQLESDDNQTVDVQGEGAEQTFVIESADPEVIYVPVYDTTVAYGPWWYPTHPPYPYYPPAWHTGAAIAVGFAWGYAWGHCDWHGGDVDINVQRNMHINRHIDRNAYAKRGDGLASGKGPWKHDPGHRGSVPYRDKETATRFAGASATEVVQARDSFRGRAASTTVRTPSPTTGVRDSVSVADRAMAESDKGGGASDRLSSRTEDTKRKASTRGGALDGVDRRGSEVRRESSRGSSSRSISRGGGGKRSGGGGRGR